MTALAILGGIRYRKKDPADMDLSPEAATSQTPHGFCISKRDAGLRGRNPSAAQHSLPTAS